jgi:predicted nucleic acid-binding protein
VGIIEQIAKRRTYLDVNIFIYALEAHPQYLKIVSELFAAIDHGDVRAVTSELSLGEALVKPFMDQRPDLQAAYAQAIASTSSLEVAPISRDVLIRAALIRAEHRTRLPDAIHLATAQLSACGAFVTNDSHIPAVSGLEILQLSDLSAREVDPVSFTQSERAR